MSGDNLYIGTRGSTGERYVCRACQREARDRSRGKPARRYQRKQAAA